MDALGYQDLLKHHEIKESDMKYTFSDEDLWKLSLTLDNWEKSSRSLGMLAPDIENIKSQGDAEEQRIKMLECWKQRCGSMATYEAMAKALLQINRIDLVEKVILLRKSSCHQQTASTLPSGGGISHKGTGQKVISILRELEDDFYELVISTETALKSMHKVEIDKITRRFSMLPQSIRRQHQTDENYKETRRRILESKTVKELFDNLTELKHWNYMTPDTLSYILKDVDNNDVHKRIDEYKAKLLAFKSSTKLRELIGISFPVPDYCIELTMEVEGWEDKTIQEVENRAVNGVRRAAYGSPSVSLGWKGVIPGSIKLLFIFMPEPAKLIPEKLFKDSGIVNIHIDDKLYTKDTQSESSEVLSSRLPVWCRIKTNVYSATGGRDVIIIAPDLLSLPHPEAVARRPGQLIEEDKLKLQSQGVPPDCPEDELSLIKARYELHKESNIVEIKSGQSLSREEVIESIGYVLNTTQNHGILLHYIGAGRRSTGDWCFEDGFITFWDIAQLYLEASHNFEGRVLSIVSDCSYAGRWVKDCVEFLDEQGVQPCGHKAREKGMIIKVMTSCRFNEIPTEYCFVVSSMRNEKTTGYITFKKSRLSETQTAHWIDSSFLNCNKKAIGEQCTLPPGLTWRLRFDGDIRNTG